MSVVNFVLIICVTLILTMYTSDWAAEGDTMRATAGTLGVAWALFGANYLQIRRLEARE